MVILTTNTFASILEWFWDDKNHCALTGFRSCLFKIKVKQCVSNDYFNVQRSGTACENETVGKNFKEKSLNALSFLDIEVPGCGERNIKWTKLSSTLIYMEENLNILVGLDSCHYSLLWYSLDENICSCYVRELGKLSVRHAEVHEQE